MSALQFVEDPKYSAIIFRKTYADLALPGALMDRAGDWLGGTDARWNGQEKTWTFPSGAKLTFGYLEHENDKYRYKSAEFQFIGFDELTQFSETQYTYLFSRLRRLKESDIPLRMRSASNPGDIGHEWVKQRFIIEGEAKGRIFIPAKLDDNPYIDKDEYTKSLMELDPVERERLLSGDWDIRPAGFKFQRHWFPVVDQPPAAGDIVKSVRAWDEAATEPKPGTDPDYLVGLYMSKTKEGEYYIHDIRRARLTPKEGDDLILQTAHVDGRHVSVRIEQEPGSAGVKRIDYLQRHVLAGFDFRGERTTGSKEIRANPVASMAEAGHIKLVRGPWISDFLNEVEIFPTPKMHDDQVDAMSLAFQYLCDIVTSKTPIIDLGETQTAQQAGNFDFESGTW